jgi:hypothetical protein
MSLLENLVSSWNKRRKCCGFGMNIPDPKEGGKCVLPFFVATKQKKNRKKHEQIHKEF